VGLSVDADGFEGAEDVEGCVAWVKEDAELGWYL
jgi:hypothetical protein